MIKRTFLSLLPNEYKKALENFKPVFDFHMSVITEEILRKVKPISIFLIGSFGRNEGSLCMKGKDVHPLRDYDVLLIVKRHVNSDVIASIRQSIHQRLGLPDPFLREFKASGFTVWITQATLNEINAIPLLKFYELKEASTLLWGDDIRPNINLSIEDISLYNCVLILFSKIEGLLGLLDPKLMTGEKTSGMMDLIYECMKTYTEIGTCLSLLAKVYEPSFIGRCAKLSSNFKELFPDLLLVNKNLPHLISKCAYGRLLICEDSLKEINLSRLIVKTIDDLKVSIWYFLQKAYNVNILPFTIENVNEYQEKFSTKLLEELFDRYLSAKLGFHKRFLAKIAARLYLRYTLLRFIITGRIEGKSIRFSALFLRNGNIMLYLWLTGLLLLSSIGPEFEFNDKLFPIIEKRLSRVVDQKFLNQQISKNNPVLKFLSLRRITIELLDLADRVFHRKD